ncbi:MAG: hypothetical protein ACI8XM_000191 [Haloarculaceae archaeon]|jgi:hypothetical protein
MYEIEQTAYGLRITLSGQLDAAESEAFAEEVRSQVRQLDDGFSVLADLRGMEAFPPEVGEQIAELMAFCNEQGMGRSADVVETATTSLQMEQLVEQAGIDERVIDASSVDDWEQQALEWIERGEEIEQ